MNFYEQIFSRGRATGEGMTHFERLFAAKFGGSPAPEVREYTGPVPVTITADGTPLIDYLISGNTVQSGTPTPDSPIIPQGCGDLETSGTKTGHYKIPISSANTTTPVYLGEVETMRRVKKLVLTGTENWVANQNGDKRFYYMTVVDSQVIHANLFCTHFVQATIGSTTSNIGIQFAGEVQLRIRPENTATSTADSFKAWLAQQYAAGTPVCVWYVLAEPETAVVNEPLMRIGDYADTLSKAQAGVEIPTNNGSTTIDVDTEVKPSEVYIKYMGR